MSRTSTRRILKAIEIQPITLVGASAPEAAAPSEQTQEADEPAAPAAEAPTSESEQGSEEASDVVS